MALPSVTARPLVLVAVAAALLLAGCAAADPEPDATLGAGASGGGAGSEPTGDDSVGAETAGGLGQATADGMPALGLVECPQLDDYEYSTTGSQLFWRLAYTCSSRDAFDASAAALVAAGYEASPLVISDGANISERNHLQADANGGSTEVQLNIVGSPADLEYEVYVVITCPDSCAGS